MQAFLRTQQEVMTAYLGGSAADDPVWTGLNGVAASPIDGRHRQARARALGGRKFAGSSRAPRSRRSSILEAHDDPIAQHHTLGGRKISAVDPSLLGLPVLPFAVMAEMTAQVAALVVRAGAGPHRSQSRSGSQVGALRGASRSTSSCEAHRVSSPDDDRVWVGIFNRGTDGKTEAARPVFEAIAIFGESCPRPAAGRGLVARECPSQQVHRPVGLRRAVAIPRPTLSGHRPHGQAFRQRNRGTLASAPPGAAGQERATDDVSHRPGRHR